MLKIKILSFMVSLGLILLLGSSICYGLASSLSKSFDSVGNINNGYIVSLDSLSSNTVQVATTYNQNNIVGVAVNPSQSLLAVNPSQNTIQVATEGSAYVAVTNLNGSIKMGNQIAISPLNGVGMLAYPGSKVVGVAQETFSSNSTGKYFTIKTKAGSKVRVKVGFIKILILVGSTNNSSSLVGGVQNFTEALVGKSISSLKIVVSLVIASLGIVSIITIVYAAIDGTIVAIGRNPLARKNIFRVLRNVSFFAVIVLILSLLSIYLIID